MWYNTGAARPNRLESKKDKAYHSDYAKYCLSTLGNHIYRSYVNKCLINWSFFKGGDGQWIFEEDTEGFFLDESGDIRNRIKWSKNVIKPMVQQYVGNAIRLSYDARAECISDFIINKRREDLAKLKGFNKIADTFPFFKDTIKDRLPIGDTELETEEIHMNSFTEEYQEDINNLLEYVSRDINIDELKVQITRNLALCGLGIYKGFESGDVYRAEATNPLYFFWDMSAKKPDLTDAEFMGEWYYMDVPSIVERYPFLSREQIGAMERYCQNALSGMHRVINGVYTPTGGKVPVYEVYWKDYERKEYGWVNDEFNYPYYTLINDPTVPYKDKDLIEPVTEKHKEEMGKKKKHTIFVDILRYAVTIPQEELGWSEGDIVLEHGVMPYQEKNLYDPANVKFPYKIYTWVYDRGEVLTPLDDAIDPQRFLNRTMSVVEAHMANMRGSGSAISKDAVDDNEAETVRNINASKPIFVDTSRTGSVQNSVGQYGTNVGGDTYNMFQVIREVQNGIQDTTGVNEAMTGTQGSSDVLVGVIDAQIQRGSLVQEPFYFGVTSVLKQAYEHIATVGKAIYHDNPRRLAMIVGDKGLKNISITKDHMNQDYGIFIERGETREQGIKTGDQLLFTLLQAGLLDEKRFSNLFGRSNSTQIARAIREFAKEKEQSLIQQDKLNAERAMTEANQQEQMAVGMAQQAQDMSNMQQVEGALAHERELEKINAKKA
jgi:hypothetical protein